MSRVAQLIAEVCFGVTSLIISAASVAIVSPAVAEKPENLTPFLDCTARNDEKDYIGYFGYLNPENSNTTIPVGDDNRFSPPPEAQGQPTTFLPGTHHFVFQVPHNGGAITWHLFNRRANSSQEWHERCKPSCTIVSPIEVDSCSDEAQVNGSLSSTLNNQGSFTSVTWSTNCPGGYFTDEDSLTPTLHIPGLEAANLPESCSVKLTLGDDTGYGSNNPHEQQVVSCSAPVNFTPCTVDCAGTSGGDAVVDACGVCNGDNSSCRDCNGVPNGGAVVDQCEVCGGHNETCADCAGVPNGSAARDVCGVCGGDGSSCADCAGVPNGPAVIDRCGVCGGNGTSCAGCAKGKKGGQQIDACGICGGDGSSCADCAGVPNGSTELDACGVCGGDGSTCLDCAGVPGGTTPVDACGGCGRKTVACGLCRRVRVARTGAIPSGFRELFSSIRDYWERTESCGRGPLRAGNGSLDDAQKLRLLILRILRSDFPPLRDICSGDICRPVSTIRIKKVLRRAATRLYSLLAELQNLDRICHHRDRWHGGKTSGQAAYEGILEAIDHLPDSVISCREPSTSS